MASPGLVAVTNTTPIVALVAVGEERLFDELFDRVIVPLDVWMELADKQGAPEPGALLALKKVVVLPTPSPHPETAHLDAGERAVIAFAASHPGTWALLDEKKARHAAKQAGLPVRGTLGMLVEAKRRGLVQRVQPLIEQMVRSGYWLDDKLIAGVLRSVSEA